MESIFTRKYLYHYRFPAPVSSIPSSHFLLPSVSRIIAGMHFRTERGRMSKLLPSAAAAAAAATEWLCILTVGPASTTSFLGPWGI
jgi:hypothetical protein